MIHLRPYQPHDLPAIVALFQASVSQLTTEHYDAAQRQAWSPEVADMPTWQTRLALLELFIAEEGQTIASFIGFSLGGHIDLLFTAPGFARQGIASALYAAAEQRLRAAGARELFTEASLTARPFFARQGFSEEQAQTVTRGAVNLQRFVMRKSWSRDEHPDDYPAGRSCAGRLRSGAVELAQPAQAGEAG